MTSIPTTSDGSQQRELSISNRTLIAAEAGRTPRPYGACSIPHETPGSPTASASRSVVHGGTTTNGGRCPGPCRRSGPLSLTAGNEPQRPLLQSHLLVVHHSRSRRSEFSRGSWMVVIPGACGSVWCSMA